jgi:hypothetical protein
VLGCIDIVRRGDIVCLPLLLEGAIHKFKFHHIMGTCSRRQNKDSLHSSMQVFDHEKRMIWE